MKFLGAKRWKGPTTDHFNGKVFHNLDGKDHGLFEAVKWAATRTPAMWPPFVETRQHPHPPSSHVEQGSCRVTFVNHATVLIQCAGLNILTDPLWSERTSPVTFAGPKRVTRPGVSLDDLPPIDFILLSHNHYDHMDLVTLRILQKRFQPKILTGLGNSLYLKERGINNALDLDWWDEHRLSDDITSVFVPARHFSSRSVTDRNRTLWGGFVLKTPAGAVYFAGDTGFGSHFAELKQKFGPMLLAILPIGCYEPRWFMGPVHMNPEDAVRAHMELNTAYSLGVHFGTFQLTDESRDAPLAALDQARLGHEISPQRFFVLDPGQGRILRSEPS